MADGLVHATPTGMSAHPGLPPDAHLVSDRLWVAEIVYFPIETELVKLASAMLARQGGEEFVVFLPSKAGDPFDQAERIRETVEQIRYPGLGVDVIVTTSIGFSKASAGCSSLSELCREADRALYLAKAAGRNRVCGANFSDLPSTTLRVAT